MLQPLRGDEPIRVDYTKSCNQGFQDFAIHVIRATGTLDVLITARPNAGGSGNVEAVKHPSWVPQWHLSRPGDTIPVDVSEKPWEQPVEQRLNVEETLAVSITDNMLRACGVILGAVLSIAHPWELDLVLESSACAFTTGPPFTFEQLRAIAKTPSGGMSSTNWDLLDLLVIKAGEAGAKNHFSDARHRDGANTDGAEPNKEDVLASCFQKWIGTKFFTTTEGSTDLSAARIREDDILVGLRGLRPVAVLRPVHERYKFLGTAYVDGADSKANPQHQTGEEIFEIC